MACWAACVGSLGFAAATLRRLDVVEESADLILLSEARPYPCSPLGAALDRVNAGFVLNAC